MVLYHLAIVSTGLCRSSSEKQILKKKERQRSKVLGKLRTDILKNILCVEEKPPTGFGKFSGV